MKTIRILSALLLVTVSAAHVQAQTQTQAQTQNMSMPMKPAASAPAKSAMPLVDAEVRKVDAARGMVVLRHGDIPNLAMPAMTMGFDVADKKMLSGLKVGDKVKFQAQMLGGKATVTQLQVL